ncbi:histidine phosphatase family protein [Brooklawnia sp.]|uniref:histidine phosphatase family protein n=1 Tax=Brooklawnia sp. TaxID=2699740 RepID=UPI00311F0C51
MTRIAFVRHGQTSWNATDRFQGSSNIELNDTGRGQAHQAAGWLLANLPDARWDFVRYSPLSRAAETGAIIADAVSIDRRSALPTLTERDWGAAEGLTFEGCVERWPLMGQVDEFAARELIPGAEPGSLVVERGRYAISTLVDQFPEAQAICATHGTVLRMTMNDVFGGQIGFIPNTGIVVIDAWREDGAVCAELIAKSWD